MTRKIEFPEIVSIREIIAEMVLQNTDISNGRYIEESAALRGHRSFIHQRQFVGTGETSIQFGYFGNVGIKVRKSGEFWCYVQNSGGSFGTYCKIHDEFAILLGISGADANERQLNISRAWTFEAISRNDGKTLLIGHQSIGSTGFRWPYHLAEFETERFNSEATEFYSGADMEIIEKAKRQRALAASFVKGQVVDIAGAEFAGIRVIHDKY